MTKHWIISPAVGSSQLTEQSWLRVIETDDRLTSPPSRGVPNPFKLTAQMEVAPHPYSVVIVIDGDRVGSMAWSEDGSPGLIASCEKEEHWARMQLLVEELANQFSCNVKQVIE